MENSDSEQMPAKGKHLGNSLVDWSGWLPSGVIGHVESSHQLLTPIHCFTEIPLSGVFRAQVWSMHRGIAAVHGF